MIYKITKASGGKKKTEKTEIFRNSQLLTNSILVFGATLKNNRRYMILFWQKFSISVFYSPYDLKNIFTLFELFPGIRKFRFLLVLFFKLLSIKTVSLGRKTWKLHTMFLTRFTTLDKNTLEYLESVLLSVRSGALSGEPWYTRGITRHIIYCDVLYIWRW